MKIAAITTEQINEVKAAHTKAPIFSEGGTHEAMIVKTNISKKKSYLGVSYWTPEEIKAGWRNNGDGSRSAIVSALY